MDMETQALILLQRDLDLLTKHLKASDLSEYNQQQLLKELKYAEVVNEDDLPADTVSIDSEVQIREVGGGRNFKFQIVMPSEANMQQKKVSVFAPIAIAILGYRTGCKVQWEMPNGLKTFEILEVRQKEKSLL
jgi:regulator of nucleoside diphosphate kinase